MEAFINIRLQKFLSQLFTYIFPITINTKADLFQVKESVTRLTDGDVDVRQHVSVKGGPLVL
ncbi:MAG: hypothetical protein EBZ48_09820 [Proteobacteria bacterium]|nr:hypothetical protein [Pseudomonadota bacterium]